MAGHLLLVILMYSFHEVKAQGDDSLNESSPGVFSPVPPTTPGDDYVQVGKLVVVMTGCGLSVGIILLGCAVLWLTKCAGNCLHRSPRVNDSGKSKFACGYMKSLNSAEYLPSGYDETYSIVSYEFSNAV